MSLRTVRTLATLVFLATLAALTWPGLLLVNRTDPRILGLPFHLAWFGFWILVIFVTLVLVDRVESRHDSEGDG